MGTCGCVNEKKHHTEKVAPIAWGDKLNMGELCLKNRVVMAAMSRMRCDPKDGIPNDLVARYYAQRAGSGLCITECSSWSQRGVHCPGAGEMYNEKQAEGWKKVVEQVHRKQGLLFLQLIHAGRATSPSINGGLEPWAPSAVAIRAQKSEYLRGEEYPIPKEMTLADIETTKKEFEQSVIYAKSAGFDGIELAAGNGYLIDQFLRSHTNRRTDTYGGSVANRCRFLLQLVQLALKHLQPFQIGVKLTPVGRLNDISDLNPLDTYSHLLKELSSLQIGFVELAQAQEKEEWTNCLDLHVPALKQLPDVCQALRPFFSGLIIANTGFDGESGYRKLQQKTCNAISFARLHITNPDLADRIIQGLPLNTNYDFTTFYGTGLTKKSKGYTDYPSYSGE